jgi:hypothetical protein
MDLRTRLYLGSIAVLLVGLCGAFVIFLSAGDDADGAVRYEVIDGKVYAVPLADTKAYVRDLQRFGGKAAVLAAELDRWIAGLWQGRTLAVTVAILTVAVSLGMFLVGSRLPDRVRGASEPPGPPRT